MKIMAEMSYNFAQDSGGLSMTNHWLLRIKDKRERRQTHEMIQMMAKYGDHSSPDRLVTDADVVRFFQSHGHDYNDMVEKCRRTNEIIFLVENLIGSTCQVIQGVWCFKNPHTGEENRVQAPGSFSKLTYLQLFENAVDNFKQCLEIAGFGRFQSCLSSGLASVESYITYRVEIYNSEDTSKDKLIDTNEKKVPFDTKIDMWLPEMSGGKILDKSGRNWNDFKRLQKVRDNSVIHVKVTSLAIEHKELVNLLNLFRTGVAGLLVYLHLLFGERIPSKIIRYAYLPDIELVQESENDK